MLVYQQLGKDITAAKLFQAKLPVANVALTASRAPVAPIQLASHFGWGVFQGSVPVVAHVSLSDVHQPVR